MRAALDVDAGQAQLLRVFNNRRGHHCLDSHQLPDQGDVAVFVTVKEETEITYFDKPRRQHVQQKAPDKFIGAQRHLDRSPPGFGGWRDLCCSGSAGAFGTIPRPGDHAGTTFEFPNLLKKKQQTEIIDIIDFLFLVILVDFC